MRTKPSFTMPAPNNHKEEDDVYDYVCYGWMNQRFTQKGTRNSSGSSWSISE